MNRTPEELLVVVGARLVRIPAPVAFVGGATVGLLVTDPAAPAPRATNDVDIIVKVGSYSEYTTVIAPALRAMHALEDDSEGAPLCRWRLDGVTVDVMPTDSRVLGFSNRWYEPALGSATEHTLPDGTTIRVVDAPHFVATKIEAFRGRAEGDFASSKDMEDIIALLDGRPELQGEVERASQELRGFVADAFERWLETAAFIEALPGHLPGNIDNYGRAKLIERRVRSLVDLHPRAGMSR